MFRIPLVTEKVIPLDAQHPLRLRSHGPLRLQRGAGDAARLRGIGSVQEKGEGWMLSGPVEMQVPPWAWVVLEHGRGPVQVTGLSAGRLEVAAHTGPLKVEDARQVHGRDITGPVLLTGSGERVVFEAVTGPVKVVRCPQVLEAHITGPTRVNCPQPAGRHITLRVRGPVALQVPAEARLHGRIRAAQQVQTQGIHQPPVSQSPTEVVWEATEPDTALHLDIVAEGPKGRVSIGPEPAFDAAEAADLSDMGLGFSRFVTALLGRWVGSGGRARRAPAAASDSRASHADARAEARRRVLHMLAQGKITAAEADRLLQTLE